MGTDLIIDGKYNIGRKYNYESNESNSVQDIKFDLLALAVYAPKSVSEVLAVRERMELLVDSILKSGRCQLLDILQEEGAHVGLSQ